MYGTAASVLYRNLGPDGWPCHYYRDQNICTLERYLVYEYAKTTLYERQLKLGMLSPYAEPYKLETEKISRETEIPVKKENVGHKLTEKKQTKNDVKNDMEQKPTKEKTNVEYQTIETISTPETTEWIKVRGNKSTVILEKKQENVKIDEYENKYDNLVEEDEEEEEEEWMQHTSKAHKKERKQRKKSVINYDVNEMSMTDMDKILSEECSKVQEVTLSVSGRGIGKEEELKVNDNEPEEKEEENANTINLEEVGEVLRNQEEELAHQNNVIMILKMQNNKLKEKLKEIEDH